MLWTILRRTLCTIAFLAFCFAISLPHPAQAVPFDPEQTYLINYDKSTIVIGEIDYTMALYVCSMVKKGDSVILASNGGIVGAALAINECLRDREVKILLAYAYSIAPTIAFAGVEVCMSLIDNNAIGTHQPAFEQKGKVMTDYDFAWVYFEIRRDILRSGGTFRAAYDFTEFMHSAEYSTVFSDLTIIPKTKFAEMLGDKYKGICQPVDGLYVN